MTLLMRVCMAPAIHLLLPDQGYYSHDALRAWAERLRGWRSQLAAAIYVYFDNDRAGYAARNALESRALMGVEQE